MSDDSHGIDQLGTNYGRLLLFIRKAGIEEIHYIDPSGAQSDVRFPNAGFASIATSKLAVLPFWKHNQ